MTASYIKYSGLFCKIPGDAQDHRALDMHVNDSARTFPCIHHCDPLSESCLYYIESFFAIDSVGSLLSHLLLATVLEHFSPMKTSFIISPLHLCILKFLL